jgi:type VI secretion system protein ImpA
MQIEPLPSVLDIETLLQPIAGENPAGESMQYSGLYDEIREARRADDNLEQGDWQREVKSADFRQVMSKAIPALQTRTKDLQIAAWLAEALTKIHSFAGLRDSMKLSRGLLENFWDTCFPGIEDGDQEGRANAFEWFDKQVSFAASQAPITANNGPGYFGYEEGKRFDIPENIDALDSEAAEKFRDLKAQAERENRTTSEAWQKAKNSSNRAFYEQLSFTLEECWKELQALDKAIESTFERKQMPGLNSLKKSLEDIRGVVKILLEEKRVLEPDPSDYAEGEGDGEGAVGGAAGGRASKGALNSRQDALRRLSEVADFFRRTEPHSPVAYLVQRAVKWGNMSFEQVLEELVKDSAVLGQIRETLGFNTAAGESTEQQ